MSLSFLGAVLEVKKSHDYFTGPSCLLDEAVVVRRGFGQLQSIHSREFQDQSLVALCVL